MTIAVAPAPDVGRRRRVALNAVTLLQIEIWLLVLIPDRLVVGPLGGIGSPALLVGVGLFVLWFVSVLAPGMGVARCCVPLRLVLGAMWVSILLSYALMNFHAVPQDEAQNSERFLISMVAFAGVALTAAEGLEGRNEVLRVLRSTVAAVAVMSLIGILQFRPGFDTTVYLARLPLLTYRAQLGSLQTRGGFTRPSSTALHPIEFGVIVASILAFALHFVLFDHDRAKWRRWVPFGLISFAVVVSISRSALLVAATVLGFFLASAAPRQRRQGLLLLLAFLAVVFMTVPGMLGTLKGYVFAGKKDDSISHRTDDYPYAANFLDSSPWLGRGPGTFIPDKFRLLDNQYLLSLVEVGIVGATGLVAVFSAPVLLGRGFRRRSTTEADRNLGQMFAAAGFGSLAAAATYDALSFPTFTALFALTTGLAGASWCQSRTDARSAVTCTPS